MNHLHVLLMILIACTGCAQQSGNDDVQLTALQTAAEGAPEALPERDLEAIRHQIEANWAVDPSTPGIEKMVAELTVHLGLDGSVTSVEIDPASSNGDPNWIAFAESCKRAVLKASPLTMPPDMPYAAWKTVVLVFSARDMLAP